jgi:hypothetical protein
MNIVKSPLSYLILIAGIYINYEYNLSQWRAAGVGRMTPAQEIAAIDRLTPDNGAWQAVVGAVICVVIVVVIAIARGEKFEGWK